MSSPCSRFKTNADASWPYDEYYIGEKDDKERKGGHGEHHWFGAKSIEHYTGSFLRDTMHGPGDYRWRYAGYSGIHTTYEGYFYSNNMHGYGTMSYPDGFVFTGIYSNNTRYGPGVDTDFSYEDVGLWRGMQLVRLAWKPSCCSIIPDLTQGEIGKKYVEPHRVLLASNSVVIGEINSALDLLKQNGCDPQKAVEIWSKLYPKHCTDQASKLCHVKDFQRDYYKENIQELIVIGALPESVETFISPDQVSLYENSQYYYAWNNEELLIDIMRHCFKHEQQRVGIEMSVVDLLSILSGRRQVFKKPGKYEVDCRTLLMASYLGDVQHVTQLVNDCDVYPGVTDSKGNSALMYATCGDQINVIHFLVEAGANVDGYNDSCCTPLGMAILRFLFIEKNVKPSDMIKVLTPSPVVPPPPPSTTSDQIDEWNICRDAYFLAVAGLPRAPSKLMKGNTKKSNQSFKDTPKKKTNNQPKLPEISETVSTESISDIKQIYNKITLQYVSTINDLFVVPSISESAKYIFDIDDITVGINAEEDPKKLQDKNAKKNISKIIKQTTKPSKEAMWKNSEKDISSVDPVDKLKIDTLSKIKSTILQLLSDGANPTLVKSPQPAILMAVFAGCPDLVLQLILHGADVNEKYPQMFGYTPIDIAISQPLTSNTLDLVRTLLECGSDTNHRLRFLDLVEEIPGPTLLHILLAKKLDSEIELEIQLSLLELVLQYKCDPTAQFKGRSAIDIAITKGSPIVDVFIENPNTNLNATINDSNQTILAKIFSLPFFRTANSMDRLQLITNLLLYGADPLIECQNNQETYQNMFIFMKNTFSELENAGLKPSQQSNAKDAKSKQAKAENPKAPASTKSMLRADDIGDYKQAQELMTDCARMLYIRWLQAKLMKELVIIIDRFQHRHWNMILGEHKDQKRVGLWLTPERCLEIWDILKTTRHKMYKNNRVLKHLLCMVMFYNKRFKDEYIKEKTPTALIKNGIEYDVLILLRQYSSGTKLAGDVPLKRPYVKPELISKTAKKFDVCFECILPNEEVSIKCKWCKLVVFCSMECIKVNIDRPFCHPCSEYLRSIYFPPSSSNYYNDQGEPISKSGLI